MTAGVSDEMWALLERMIKIVGEKVEHLGDDAAGEYLAHLVSDRLRYEGVDLSGEAEVVISVALAVMYQRGMLTGARWYEPGDTQHAQA